MNTRRARRLLFSAYPMGYGPAAKALVLAARCRSAGFDPVFVGQGVAHELVSRSGEIFSEVVQSDANRTAARTLTRESHAVVSVMDREFASLAGELSRPLHVVDSLLWLRDRVPEAFSSACRYWAQDFVGVREPVEGLASPVSVVGPIVSPRSAVPVTASGKLLVSLGGFDGAGDPDRNRVYGELVLEAIAGSRLATSFAGRITTLAGARASR